MDRYSDGIKTSRATVSSRIGASHEQDWSKIEQDSNRIGARLEQDSSRIRERFEHDWSKIDNETRSKQDSSGRLERLLNPPFARMVFTNACRLKSFFFFSC